jgi:hypothetical protein
MDSIGEKNKVSYEKRIFAFIDILGFAELVEESERDTSKILRIYQLLERTKSMANLPVGHKFRTLKVDLVKFRSHTFSDTVTMSCPFESFDYFNAIVGWVEGFQYLMLTEEATFVRGAIVYGNVLDDESNSMVFGPAMVAAYRLERRRAKWPRVLVDSSILDELPDEKKVRAFKEYLMKGSAGTYYLDYLRDLFALTCYDRGRRLRTPSDPIELLNGHKSAIEKAVERINEEGSISRTIVRRQGILEKYSRLASYHNRVVDRLCLVSMKLQKDHELVRRIQFEVMIQALVAIRRLPQHFKREPEFTAENLKYVDIMPVLGIAIQRIFDERKDVVNLLNNDPVKGHDSLCSELPEYLHKLEKALDSTKIDKDIFSHVLRNK